MKNNYIDLQSYFLIDEELSVQLKNKKQKLTKEELIKYLAYCRIIILNYE